MAETTCSLPDCERPLKRMGYCYAHYMKVWRYGTPYPANGWMQGDRETQVKVQRERMVDIRGQRFGTLVVIERVGRQWRCACDCGRERLVNAGDLNRNGDANTCGDRRVHRRADVAGYTAAHQRCRSDRGRVQDLECVDCGHPARHWSYNHDDPDELLGMSGRSTSLIAYSLDPSHYSPRCVPCHKRFDLDRIDAAQVH